MSFFADWGWGQRLPRSMLSKIVSVLIFMEPLKLSLQAMLLVNDKSSSLFTETKRDEPKQKSKLNI